MASLKEIGEEYGHGLEAEGFLESIGTNTFPDQQFDAHPRASLKRNIFTSRNLFRYHVSMIKVKDGKGKLTCPQ
jgi:hypothetical protein